MASSAGPSWSLLYSLRSDGQFPSFPCAAACPHEVQPPLEQPPVEAVSASLMIGNTLPGLRSAPAEAFVPALSPAADRTTSSYLVPPLQNTQSPCGGTGRSRVWARRCVTWQKKSTGSSGSPCSNSPLAGHMVHIPFSAQARHFVTRVTFFSRTLDRKLSHPSRKLPVRRS